MNHHLVSTPIGWLSLTGSDMAITRCEWADERTATVGNVAPNCAWKVDAEWQLTEYFEGTRKAFDLPIYFNGTAFQTDVWELLSHLPFGHVTTYMELAGGNASMARAVGGAVAANPIMIIVPCHRVLGHKGQLTGYAGGMQRKQFLLEHEAKADSGQLSLFGG